MGQWHRVILHSATNRPLNSTVLAIRFNSFLCLSRPSMIWPPSNFMSCHFFFSFSNPQSSQLSFCSSKYKVLFHLQALRLLLSFSRTFSTPTLFHAPAFWMMASFSLFFCQNTTSSESLQPYHSFSFLYFAAHLLYSTYHYLKVSDLFTFFFFVCLSYSWL